MLPLIVTTLASNQLESSNKLREDLGNPGADIPF